MNRFLPAVLVVVFAVFSFAAPKPPDLTPAPKVLSVTGEPFTIGKDTAIVIDSNASEPVRYAASQLQANVKKRFGFDLSIIDNSKTAAGISTKIALLVTKKEILPKPGDTRAAFNPDRAEKFAIETSPRGIFILGSDARAVIYGQFAFFDMLSKQGDSLLVPSVSIQDWPDIKWRGRPATSLAEHMETGVFDTYMRARINWIDIRDGNAPAYGIFGFPAGHKLDKEKISACMAQARKRDLFVYATVSCGVTPDQFGDVLRTFEELIAFGPDGLWISFDDPGPGDGASKLVSDIIALGKKHGITPDRIGITPPSGSYQVIDVEWNETIAKVPGASEMVWFFTRPPCASDVKLAQQIGINRLPAWWHNWPRVTGGLLHLSSGGQTLYDSKYAYFEPVGIEVGWDSPYYDELRDTGKYTDTVMIWSDCVTAEYGTPMIGYWGWNTAAENWSKTKHAIYSQVYGPAMANTAADFDNTLASLRELFTTPRYRDTSATLWPPRLKNVSTRAQAQKLLARMDADLKALEANSPAQTLLDPQRLRERFLVLMRDVVTYGNKLAAIEYPEYSYSRLVSHLDNLADKGKIADINTVLAKARPAIQAQLAEIKVQLSTLKDTNEYFKQWNQYISGPQYWVNGAAERAKEKAERAANRALCRSNYASYAPNIKDLLAGFDTPPADKVLASLTGADLARADFRSTGDYWGVGSYNSQVMAIVCPPGKSGKKGDKAEVSMVLRMPEYSGPRRMMLQLYVNYQAPDSAPESARHMYISTNKKTCWMQDMALGMKGSRWITQDLRNAYFPGENLKIRFSVVNAKDVNDYPSIAVVGPARFVER